MRRVENGFCFYASFPELCVSAAKIRYYVLPELTASKNASDCLDYHILVYVFRYTAFSVYEPHYWKFEVVSCVEESVPEVTVFYPCGEI